MKLFITVTVLALIAGGLYMFSGSMRQNEPNSDKRSTQAEPSTQTTGSASSSVSTTSNDQIALGKYIDYSAKSIEETAGTKILFFHAPWCPQCRALEASIKAGQIPDNVTILTVDYDSNQALRQKYGVTIQTTLVKVDDEGKLIKKFVAYDDPTLKSVTEQLLP